MVRGHDRARLATARTKVELGTAAAAREATTGGHGTPGVAAGQHGAREVQHSGPTERSRVLTRGDRATGMAARGRKGRGGTEAAVQHGTVGLTHAREELGDGATGAIGGGMVLQPSQP